MYYTRCKRYKDKMSYRKFKNLRDELTNVKNYKKAKDEKI